MKKIVFVLLVFASVSAFSQNAEWRLGLQLGFHGSCVKYAGGMTEANSRFSTDGFCTPNFDFKVRYDLNDHWMFLSGLGFTQTGFQFYIAEDYSLLSCERKYTSIRTVYPVTQIPLLASYKTKLNCRNNRYFVGCGIVMNFTGNTAEEYFTEHGSDASLPDTTYLNAVVSGSSSASLDPRFIAGMEKVFKKGNMLSVEFVAHIGTRPTISADVTYNIDGTEYFHKFSNNGNYCGLTFTYYFRKPGWKKEQLKMLAE